MALHLVLSAASVLCTLSRTSVKFKEKSIGTNLEREKIGHSDELSSVT